MIADSKDVWIIIGPITAATIAAAIGGVIYYRRRKRKNGQTK
jgi:hypothetical protein